MAVERLLMKQPRKQEISAGDFQCSIKGCNEPSFRTILARDEVYAEVARVGLCLCEKHYKMVEYAFSKAVEESLVGRKIRVQVEGYEPRVIVGVVTKDTSDCLELRNAIVEKCRFGEDWKITPKEFRQNSKFILNKSLVCIIEVLDQPITEEKSE